ncbi:hypothetical protein GmHk_08G022411 [Glycine max]|nr:hypothetical protein GmHk_08G022411 [Glycine max]
MVPGTSGSIKCFKWLGKGHIALHCPNKKTNFLRENEIAISDFSSISSSYISSDNDSRCGTKYLDDGLMMCKRLLGIQCKDKDEIQKKNIFQTRCLVLGNVCSLIIDGGSYINVSNTSVDGSNSRSNSLKEGGDDENQPRSMDLEAEHESDEPITRACTKQMVNED